MLREFFFSDDFLAAAAERARAMHSRWLSRALRHGGGNNVPRIPTRRVSQGGYDPLMATVEGREWAEEWWNITLNSDQLL